MQKLIFGTTNENKLQEASQILGLPVEGIKLDVPEIQTLDQLKIATYKAKGYYQQLHTPLFVEDTGLIFHALNGLPGAYTSDFSKALGNEGLFKLLKSFSNYSATAQTILVFIDEKGETHHFEGSIEGTITSPIGDQGFGWDPIFIPSGHTQTFAQMNSEDKNKFSMRRLAFEKFKNFLSK